MYKTQLPQVKDEVTLAQIMIYPSLTEAHKQELINRLKKNQAGYYRRGNF